MEARSFKGPSTSKRLLSEGCFSLTCRHGRPNSSTVPSALHCCLWLGFAIKGHSTAKSQLSTAVCDGHLSPMPNACLRLAIGCGTQRLRVGVNIISLSAGSGWFYSCSFHLNLLRHIRIWAQSKICYTLRHSKSQLHPSLRFISIFVFKYFGESRMTQKTSKAAFLLPFINILRKVISGFPR